jgi:GntR family transcriptional regulator
MDPQQGIRRGGKNSSEHELAERFQVSRLTVRQAISQLVQEGFLISRRGQGTFVTRDENLIDSFSLEFQGVMDDLFFRQISKVQIKSAQIQKVAPPKSIREKLGLDPETGEVFLVRRVRYIKDRPFTYTVNYLPLDIGRRIREKDLYHNALMNILEQKAGVQFTEAVQTIEAGFANSEVAESLRIAAGSPILFVERIMYGPKRRPVEVFQCSYLGDLYKIIVRFKNIRRKNGRRWIHA